MNIGQRIKEKRKELKMSADELAKRLGKDRSTIYRYEKGDIENLPLDILEPIANALETTPAYLMGWVSEETSKKNSTITDIIVHLRSDDDFLSLVETLHSMDADKMQAVRAMLSALLK